MRRVFRIPFSKTRIVREVDDELAFHLETRVERLIADGWNRDDARREALRQFGELAPVRDSMVALDEQREQTAARSDMLGDVRQDLRYATRTLRRNRAVSAVIIALLAIGIGANTAIFSLVDALLVRPLPVHRPDQLVVIGDPALAGSVGAGAPRTDALSAPLYRDIRDGNSVFTGVLASGSAGRLDARIDAKGDLEHPRGRFVSANYFAVLGVRAIQGRTFDATTRDIAGASPEVTISHGYWTRRFNNDPSVVGRTITIDGVSMMISGVTPPDFTGDVVGLSPDVWIPLSMHDAIKPNSKLLNARSVSWLLGLGRLKPGVTIPRAHSHITALMEASILNNASPRQAAAFRASPRRYNVASGARGLSEVREDFRAPLITLLAGVALLLCVICANVANLLLARAIARGREMSVRLALGAGRSRLVRQLMTEAAVLAATGCAIGLVVAWWGSRALLALAADGDALPLSIRLNPTVLGFTLLVSIAAVVLFGLVPALRASRVDLASAMRASSTSSGSGGSRLRGMRTSATAWLIAGQVALSVVLLMGALMLVRSLRHIQTIDTGLDRDHLIVVDAAIQSRGYRDARLRNLVRAIRDRVGALPGVAGVTFSENGLFSGTDWSTEIQVPGFTASAPRDTVIGTDQVGANYARAIGARIISGRDLSTADEEVLPRNILLNETAARFYFGSTNPVGRFIRLDSMNLQIVGVIGDVRDHELTAPPRRRMYSSFLHAADTANGSPPGALRLLVRTHGDPAALLTTVRTAVSSIDPDLPIVTVVPLTTLMRATIRQERLLANVATGFGALALLLAAVGLYGVLTYAVTRRTAEIGVRVALGAQQADVARSVILDALRLVGLGITLGVPLAVASVQLLRTQLHDAQMVDPIPMVIAVAVLLVTALVAAAVPAVRASRVSPLAALRAEV